MPCAGSAPHGKPADRRSVTGGHTLRRALHGWRDGTFAMSAWSARTPTGRLPRMADSSHFLLRRACILATGSGRWPLMGSNQNVMTYCCGILVQDGLVMIADTRTDAGLDNISIFRKLHTFTNPGERVMATAASGNLSITHEHRHADRRAGGAARRLFDRAHLSHQARRALFHRPARTLVGGAARRPRQHSAGPL